MESCAMIKYKCLIFFPPPPRENERNTNGNNTFPPGTPFSRDSHLGLLQEAHQNMGWGHMCQKSARGQLLYTDGPPNQLRGTGIMPPHVAEETVEPVGLTS